MDTPIGEYGVARRPDNTSQNSSLMHPFTSGTSTPVTEAPALASGLPGWPAVLIVAVSLAHAAIAGVTGSRCLRLRPVPDPAQEAEGALAQGRIQVQAPAAARYPRPGRRPEPCTAG
jgi:hypothetical protein